ncbi:MAG: hypothetical protein LBP92_14060 [Deltaproteobacteria bacterium]|jgi:hypothetical protein|nr:hypothetical protein [Deltaproteobacteria bacterium]
MATQDFTLNELCIKINFLLDEILDFNLFKEQSLVNYMILLDLFCDLFFNFNKYILKDTHNYELDILYFKSLSNYSILYSSMANIYLKTQDKHVANYLKDKLDIIREIIDFKYIMSKRYKKLLHIVADYYILANIKKEYSYAIKDVLYARKMSNKVLFFQIKEVTVFL